MTKEKNVATIVLPHGCKPSKAVSTDQTRPILCHAYLRRRKGDLWLEATDSFIAVALRCEGTAKEGWLPVDVLKLMEREANRKVQRLCFTQDDEATWTVTDQSGLYQTVTTYMVPERSRGKWPNLEALGLYDDPKVAEAVDPFGFNPSLLANVGAALGGTLRVDFQGPLKPIALRTQSGDGLALQMPVRLVESEVTQMPKRSRRRKAA